MTDIQGTFPNLKHQWPNLPKYLLRIPIMLPCWVRWILDLLLHEFITGAIGGEGYIYLFANRVLSLLFSKNVVEIEIGLNSSIIYFCFVMSEKHIISIYSIKCSVSISVKRDMNVNNWIVFNCKTKHRTTCISKATNLCKQLLFLEHYSFIFDHSDRKKYNLYISMIIRLVLIRNPNTTQFNAYTIYRYSLVYPNIGTSLVVWENKLKKDHTPVTILGSREVTSMDNKVHDIKV